MTSEKYRDCKAFQSHELFPLLKLLADSHDRIPGQDHPEVMHNEMESLLRLELGKYDDRTRIHNPKVKEKRDDVTQAILDEMSNLLDNCRTLLDLHKQCHRRMQQQICHIQKDFLEQSSAIINSVKPLQQAPVYQPWGDGATPGTVEPRGDGATPGTVETGGSVLVGKRSADSLENRPSQLQLHPRAANASSSNFPPAKRRICASHILDGRQRAEVTNDESADDTSVSRYEERSPPDGEQELISPGLDNEQDRMKSTFRHPPTVTGYLKEWYSKHEKVCRVEGSMDSSCALNGSRESVKCQARQEACRPRWNNQLRSLISVGELRTVPNAQG
ncbi:uncharacterized protein LOC135805346 isoform X2 [Sycon ciliatum]|uniref:uncharacterized protein LOC135805346 isoform X2 n=1 Tax=Sycon ciliatum TaxID=27933 RepID=UPI0031F6AF6A